MPLKRARGIFFVAIILLLFSVASAKPVIADSPAGIMIPLYTYPGATWDQTISVKSDYQSVPVAAIVNPSNGPGWSKDANYDSGIAELRQAGVIVLGYVSTAYTGRSLDSVKADIDRWDSWYDIDGIFFDEQTNWAGGEWYYDQADAYAKGKGYTMTVGNPGANSIPSYLDTVDVVLIYESPGLPNLSNYQGWSSYSNEKLGMIPFNVGSMPSQWVENAVGIVGWIYVTDDKLPNPWDSLPPYLGELAAALAGQTSTTSHSLTISSVDQNGDSIDGMWVEVKRNSATIHSGFTPMTLSLESSTYVVTAADYQQIIFDHWSDGTGSSSKSIALSGDSALTAHYQNGAPEDPDRTLSIVSVNQNGEPIDGLWTEISIDGILQTGYTPVEYTLQQNLVHRVAVADYQNFVFDHWQDSGSTARERDVALAQDVELVAVYQDTNIPEAPHEEEPPEEEPEEPPQEQPEPDNTFVLTQDGSARLRKNTDSFERGTYDARIVISGQYGIDGGKVTFDQLAGVLVLSDKEGNEMTIDLVIEKFKYSKKYLLYRAEAEDGSSGSILGRIKIGSIDDAEDRESRGGYANAKIDSTRFSIKKISSSIDFT